MYLRQNRTFYVNGWADTDTYNPNAAGSYTSTATLGAIPSGCANTGNHTATIEVVVNVAENTYIPPTVTQPIDNKVDIIFGDKAEKVATAEVKVKDNIKTTTITLDDAAAIEYLDKIAKANLEENKVNKVIIPVKNKSDVVIAELNGQTVKYMGAKDAALEIKTENITYNIPAVNINIDDVLTQFETKVELRDIKVIISVTNSSKETVKNNKIKSI